MSEALVQGLQRRIAELEEDLRNKKVIESKCRRLEAELATLSKKMGSDTDPLACSICFEPTTGVLPCFHRACSKCIANHTIASTRYSESPTCTCPVCRTPFVTNMTGCELITIGTLGDNGTLDKMEEVAIRKQEAETVRSYVFRLYGWAKHTKRCGYDDPYKQRKARSEPSSPVLRNQERSIV